MALDAISTSASPSECITLISEANSWSQAFQEKLVCYLDAEESHLFSQSMDYLPSFPLLCLICLLPFVEGTK